MNSLDQALEIATADGRVCPQPSPWQQLWELLPERKRVGAGWSPALPLILGGWHFSTPEMKRERFHDHPRWAEDHGVLDEVQALLESLAPADWHHGD